MEKVPEKKRDAKRIEAIELPPLEQPGLQTPAELPEVTHIPPMSPELDIGRFIDEQEKITERKKPKRPNLDS